MRKRLDKRLAIFELKLAFIGVEAKNRRRFCHA